MKAAVFMEIEKIEIKEDYPKPSPGPNEVLIKVDHCGICGTDVKNYYHKIYQAPLIMGHEFAGEIAEIGSEITNFKIGDRSTGVNVAGGEEVSDMRRIGVFKDGGFAEYCIVPEDYLFKIPDSVSLLEGAMVESYAVALRAIKWANIKESQNFIIIGGGNIGLITMDILKAKYPDSKILVIELHKPLQEKAIQLGAFDAIQPSKSKVRKFVKKNGGCSIVFDCAGTTKSLQFGVEIIKPGGTIVLEGIVAGNITLPGFMINNKEVAIRGSLSHDREDILETIQLMEEKKVQPERLISEILTLEQLSEGIEKFSVKKERDFIKLMVKIQEKRQIYREL
jgi:2-desacetyl-2-hydroxyethyl bacteriochlorophyllide A dehydrogenase